LITATDNIFFKAYFSMAIEVKELQQEVKEFLRDTNAVYAETLELIHTYFRIQMTGEHLHDTSTQSESTAIVQRGNADEDGALTKTNTLATQVNVAFSINHGKLFPFEYYQ